jgi:Xaa-Pro dipeptidase
VIVRDAARGGLFGELAAVLAAADPQRIAINSGTLAAADGLSATQRAALEEAVGPSLAARLVSSTPQVQEWLSVKLPAEVEIMRRAAALTARLQEEASRRTRMVFVRAGVRTTDQLDL